MPPITIYSKMLCPYCRRAKSLLQSKGATYTEIDITARPARRREMIQKSAGGMTVPQIFIGDVHVGGFDDLHALDEAGKLDPLLQSTEGSA